MFCLSWTACSVPGGLFRLSWSLSPSIGWACSPSDQPIFSLTFVLLGLLPNPFFSPVHCWRIICYHQPTINKQHPCLFYFLITNQLVLLLREAFCLLSGQLSLTFHSDHVLALTQIFAQPLYTHITVVWILRAGQSAGGGDGSLVSVLVRLRRLESPCWSMRWRFPGCLMMEGRWGSCAGPPPPPTRWRRRGGGEDSLLHTTPRGGTFCCRHAPTCVGARRPTRTGSGRMCWLPHGGSRRCHPNPPS